MLPHAPTLTFALSTSQSVTLAVVLLSAGGLAMIVFAYVAFEPQKQTRQKFESAIETITTAVKESATAVDGGAGDGGAGAAHKDPQAALGGAADYVRALGDLAEKLGKVSPPIAVLMIATVPFMFAATIVAIELLK